MNKLDVCQVRAAVTCFALKLTNALQAIDPHHKYFESIIGTNNIFGMSIQVVELQSEQALFADFYFRWDNLFSAWYPLAEAITDPLREARERNQYRHSRI